MISFLRRHEVWLFLSLLVIANAIFVTLVVKEVLPQGVYGLGRFALLGVILFGLIFLLRGWSGVVEVLRPMIEWRQSPWLYLFAIGWTVAICVLVLTAFGVVTGDFLRLSEVAEGAANLMHPKLLVTLLVSSFVGEMVWISYAVRRLSEHFSHYVSALIVGGVWTLWWLPMSIYNFGIIPDLPLLALLINQMGVAAMCAFVYYHTRSGFLVLTMQIVFNATILVFPITPTVGGPAVYWAFAITYFCAATLLFIRFGPRPLLRGRIEPLADAEASLSQPESA